MINIAKLRISDTDKDMYFASIDSYSEFVTVAKKMKLSESHPLLLDGCLCILFTNLNEEKEVLLSFNLVKNSFDSDAVLTIYWNTDTPDEVMIRVENQEIVRKLNIVDILYEINTYFIAMGGLPA